MQFSSFVSAPEKSLLPPTPATAFSLSMQLRIEDNINNIICIDPTEALGGIIDQIDLCREIGVGWEG